MALALCDAAEMAHYTALILALRLVQMCSNKFAH